ncbi:MAG: hypothetical protein ACRD44_02910 [Bryobacteraceae bacterium]
MNGKIRFFHGAMGGLIIAMAGLFAALVQGADPDFKRAAIMALLLIPICGYLAAIQESEKSPWQLFQLSLAVPSLLTGVMADVRGAGQKKDLQQQLAAAKALLEPKPPPVPQGGGGMALWSTPFSVHAADERRKTYEKAPLSPMQQIWQSVLGPGEPRNYFVVAGAYRTDAEAKLAVDEIRGRGFKSAGIFKPPKSGDPHTVVIAEQLTYPEAVQLANQAIQSGLPEWTYVWTLGLPMKDPVQHKFTLFQRRYARIPEAFGKGIWAYLTDVTTGKKDFRLYLCSAPGAWPVQRPEITEPEFRKRIAPFPHAVGTFFNKPGEQKLTLAGRVYLLKAIALTLRGNEKVDFELLRLL